MNFIIFNNLRICTQGFMKWAIYYKIMKKNCCRRWIKKRTKKRTKEEVKSSKVWPPVSHNRAETSESVQNSNHDVKMARIQDRWRGNLVWTTLYIRVYYWIHSKTPRSKDTTLYINTGSKKGYIDRMYGMESNDCGFLRTYSIIYYFSLVQGSSH